MSQASNSIIVYKGHPTEFIEAILNQLVSLGKRANYANHNADLILWIYKNDEWGEALLRYWMIERLITTEAEGRKTMCATYKD